MSISPGPANTPARRLGPRPLGCIFAQQGYRRCLYPCGPGTARVGGMEPPGGRARGLGLWVGSSSCSCLSGGWGRRAGFGWVVGLVAVLFVGGVGQVDAQVGHGEGVDCSVVVTTAGRVSVSPVKGLVVVASHVVVNVITRLSPPLVVSS